MKLKLNNETELSILCVNGASRFYQGFNRDTLEIQIAKGEKTFEELDVIFADSSSTKKLTLIDGNQEYIHDNYTLRISMELKPVVITPETPSAQAVTEERICVTMAQKSYLEL